MIKLIVTDMDGTLLNKNEELHEDFFEIFNKLKEKIFSLLLLVEGKEKTLKLNLEK